MTSKRDIITTHACRVEIALASAIGINLGRINALFKGAGELFNLYCAYFTKNWQRAR